MNPTSVLIAIPFILLAVALVAAASSAMAQVEAELQFFVDPIGPSGEAILDDWNLARE